MGWIVSIIELFAKYLTCKQKKVSFIIHSFACILWSIIFIEDKRYGALLSILVFMFMNVYGYINWNKKEKIKQLENNDYKLKLFSDSKENDEIKLKIEELRGKEKIK